MGNGSGFVGGDGRGADDPEDEIEFGGDGVHGVRALGGVDLEALHDEC